MWESQIWSWLGLSKPRKIQECHKYYVFFEGKVIDFKKNDLVRCMVKCKARCPFIVFCSSARDIQSF